MKRVIVVGAACAAIALLAGGMVYGFGREPAGGISEFDSWAPSALAIRKKIGSHQAPVAGLTDDQRRAQFCELFKSRFRQHDPAVAVGLHFVTSTRIKLMCPARMEPFLVDQIALALWHEAGDNFGKPIDIDIYDTFIGTTQIKIGELRAAAEQPDMAHIAYDFRKLQALNDPRQRQPPAIEPVMGNQPRRPAPEDLNPEKRATF